MADYTYIMQHKTKAKRYGKIIGRDTERKALSRFMKSGKAEFVALYGRRRVGKTFLVKQYFNSKFDFYMSGTIGAPMSVQLSNFREGLINAGLSNAKIPANWQEAFMTLQHCDAPYSISKDEDMKLRIRLSNFKTETGTRFGLLLTMITPFGITQGKYSGQVKDVVTMEELFG